MIQNMLPPQPNDRKGSQSQSLLMQQLMNPMPPLYRNPQLTLIVSTGLLFTTSQWSITNDKSSLTYNEGASFELHESQCQPHLTHSSDTATNYCVHSQWVSMPNKFSSATNNGHSQKIDHSDMSLG